MPPSFTSPLDIRSHDNAIVLGDLYYISTIDLFLYVPGSDLWTAQTVNGRFPLVNTGRKSAGKYVHMKPADWLRAYRAVEQQTWAPGEPEIIKDRLITDGGWRAQPDARVLNLYVPPILVLGDAAQATPWIDHLHRIYPGEAEDIANWFAHRVQFPGVKINHALVLGGGQAIGKDWLLKPLRLAVGEKYFQEISPPELLSKYTPFVKAVVLRMNEAHDLGDDSGRANRYALYERIKIYAAAPPEVLVYVDKYIRRFYVPNVLGLVITTNHKTDGVYLPSDDRRHLISWSDCTKEDFRAEFWTELYGWMNHKGGAEHVAAFLKERDLSAFNPGAIPRQTPAFYEIVNANQAPEDDEIGDALDELGRPAIVSLQSIIATKRGAALEWLHDPRRRRSIPYRLERRGYLAYQNPDSTNDGRWIINGRRQTLYAERTVPKEKRQQEALAFVAQQTKTAGNS